MVEIPKGLSVMVVVFIWKSVELIDNILASDYKINNTKLYNTCNVFI